MVKSGSRIDPRIGMRVGTAIPYPCDQLGSFSRPATPSSRGVERNSISVQYGYVQPEIFLLLTMSRSLFPLSLLEHVPLNRSIPPFNLVQFRYPIFSAETRGILPKVLPILAISCFLIFVFGHSLCNNPYFFRHAPFPNPPFCHVLFTIE